MKKLRLVQMVALALLSNSVMAYDPTFLNNNPFTLDLKQKGIYGEDDRKEFYDVHPAIQKIAGSVPAFIFTNQLKLDSTGQYYLINQQLNIKTCKDEAFSSQPQAAYCSGFVIDDNKIASAGHCIIQDTNQTPYNVGDVCDKVSLVFGYKLNAKGQMPARIPVNDVYRCKTILSKELNRANKDDYSVLEVDRVMSGHPPLAVSGDEKIADNESVGVIGYPYGLPMKITGGATVRNNDKSNFFTTDLDTFGGNSGSPVLNATSLINGEAKVEGLLVRGATDFVASDKGCAKVSRCTVQDARSRSCKGEDVTRINKVKKFAKLIHSRPSAQTLQIKARQAKVKLNDELKIDLQIPKAGYLNVIEVNPVGTYTLLYPNQFATNNYVKAGKMTITDTSAWNLQILSGPYGQHRLFAVLSEQPNNLYQKKSTELKGQIQAFAPSSVEDLVLVTRGAGAVKLQPNNCKNKGAGATARCQDKPLVKSTQVCYFEKPSDCP